MVGRAGRAGFGETGESIMLCSLEDNQKVCELLCSPMDEVISQMAHFDSRALEAMILRYNVKSFVYISVWKKLNYCNDFFFQCYRIKYCILSR